MTQKVIDVVVVERKIEPAPKKKIDSSRPHRPRRTSEKKPDEKLKKQPVVINSKVKVFWPRFLFLILAVVIVCGGATVFAHFNSKMSLRIYPLLEDAEITEEIQVLAAQEVMDVTKKVLAGRIFETDEAKKSTFQATGKVVEGKKAEGNILLYNTSNPPIPVNLAAKTRFLSAKEGKIFRSLSKIYLPPSKVQGGKVIPSVVEVRVVAQEEGESYNIEPSKFSVPGLAGTALYYNVWAESKSKMQGGLVTEAKKIILEDIMQAQDKLKSDLAAAALTSLKNKLPPDFSLNEKMISVEDFQSSCSEKEETRKDSFECSGNMKVKAIAYQISQLDQLAEALLALSLSSSQKIYEPSLAVFLIPKSSLTESENLVSGLKIKAKVYDDIDKNLLVAQIKGKNRSEIGEIIKANYPKVKKIESKFWPFWIQKAPQNREKIGLEVVF